MLTYEQKRFFLIVIVLIMFVPMILIGLGRAIKQEIHDRRCPAIREVGEFQTVFNEYAAAYGLSIDLSEVQWRESGYYHAKTVPVHGDETQLYCKVVAKDESYGAEVMRVEFFGAYESEEDAEIARLSKLLKSCFRIFAPSAYAEYASKVLYVDDYSYVELMEKAFETWNQEEAEFFDNFLSDDVQKDKLENEHLEIRSCITEDGKYEKSFLWS